MKIGLISRVYSAKFMSNEFYHVFNKGNNGDRIFYRDENYRYFLRKISYYLAPFLDLYAYCLLPNHFHLLVRVRPRPTHLAFDSKLHAHSISNHFRCLFISYSQAIHRQQGRTGSLFQKSFRRVHVNSQNYLQWVIYYIHKNPVHHQICRDMTRYKWSSYRALVQQFCPSLPQEELFRIYGGRDQFLAYHRQHYQDFEDIVQMQKSIGME